MDCDLKRSADVVARHTLNAADALQLVLSLYLCLAAGALKGREACARGEAAAWTDAVFYLSALWLGHLLMHALTRRKRSQTERFFGLLGAAFLAALAALWAALALLWSRDAFFGRCSSAHDLFGFVFLAVGAAGAVMLAVMALGFVLRLVRPKSHGGRALAGSEAPAGSFVQEEYADY